MSVRRQFAKGFRKGKPFEVELIEIHPHFWISAALIPATMAMLWEAQEQKIRWFPMISFRTFEQTKEAWENNDWTANQRPGFSPYQTGYAFNLRFVTFLEREKFAEIAARHGWIRPIVESRTHFEYRGLGFKPRARWHGVLLSGYETLRA